ncbi:glycoside hydrolase family 76 protein [Acidomyces richmondensis BFW]|nr:MAG: glycoside hydrolase family 76 protein [Acidomyces sp. 'richmondensis']KYG48127.1 glycoside hydrolase family 76 protein [Acidomyces richmondensis BFW]
MPAASKELNVPRWIPSTGWWNSANCLTVIADLAAIDQKIKAESYGVFANTFVRAQLYNMQMEKTMGPNSLPITYYGNHWPTFPPGWKKPPFIQTDGFLDNYYDDEGWWSLAWIAAYDITGDTRYLQMAESIFSNMAAAYNTTPCGGLWWDKSHTYVNAIANELFLDVAAHLANRAGPRSSYYLKYAEEEWNWFYNSGMINSQHLINDGLTSTCQNNGETIWSYNQGVILGGLTELSKATKNSSYITIAKQIGDAAIANLTRDGILHDVCEPNCGADGSQFKGIFARNLQILQQYSPEARYATFLEENANSIWTNDREGDELSLIWSGPFIYPANASTQSSAMDAIVGALATS